MCPAVMVYSRVIKDHLQALQDKYRIHKIWGDVDRYRETAMTKRHMKCEMIYNANFGNNELENLPKYRNKSAHTHVDGQKLGEW